MMKHEARAVIIGATTLVTPYLVKRLSAAGFHGEILGRRCPLPGTAETGFPWAQFDLESPADWRAPPGSTVFFLAPLVTLPKFLHALSEARHVVALSSTSAIAYARSKDPKEQTLSRSLLVAEDQVLAATLNKGVACTILRPTMIYGQGRDSTISTIISFVDRFRFFPLAAPGEGLRQPVHADDVAAAAAAATRTRLSAHKIFEIGGGEVLTFRDMVGSALLQAGRPPRILAAPAAMLRFGGRLIGRSLPHTNVGAMIARMNTDQVFNIDAARRAFNYAPRPFRLDPEDIPRRKALRDSLV